MMTSFISFSVIVLLSSPVYPFLLHPGRFSPASAAVLNHGFKQIGDSSLKYRIDSDACAGESSYEGFKFISNNNDISGSQSSSDSSSRSTTSRTNALYSLSVTELKRLLNDRGIDFRDCFEKRDLVERLENSSSLSATGSWKANGNGSSGSNHLSDGERSVVDTFKRVSPAVANIKTSTVLSQRNSLFGLNLGAGMEVPLGSGSGFLWDDKGHVVTNYHVISPPRTSKNNSFERNKTVMVKLAGMVEALEAKIVGVDPEKDLAVLRIVRNGKGQSRRLPRPIDVGTSNDLQVGQSVLAIGNPFGLDDTLTTGVVSALGRDVNGIGGRPIHGCVQTDAAINPGNSGGPLLDSRGRLIGVNTMIYATSGGNIGIGFAIPVDTVRRVVNQIIQYGKVVKPTIGINVLDDRIVKFIEEQLGRPLDGCLIAQIVPNGPASTSGLNATSQNNAGSLILGDLIVAVNGEPVRHSEDLISALEEKRDREIVELTVLKNCDPKKRKQVKVTLTTRDKLQKSNSNAAAWQ